VLQQIKARVNRSDRHDSDARKKGGPMKLKIRIFIIALIAGMICMLPFPVLAGNMDFVDAYFRDVGPKGCIKTEVFVFAHSGNNDAAPEASVQISRINECMDDSEAEILMDASGTVQLAKKSLIVDSQVQSAYLNTTVQVYDSVTEKNIQLRLNLIWTGTSDLKQSRRDFFYQAPGVLVKTNKNFNSISRIAQASGSLSDGFTNYASGISEDAEISTHAAKKK
jgi:hypothetical protein